MNVNWSFALAAALLIAAGSEPLQAQSSPVYSVSDGVSSSELMTELTTFNDTTATASSSSSGSCCGGKGCTSCDGKGSKGGKGTSGKAGGKGADCDSCADPCEPWRMFPEFGNGWTLTGWVALGATANADSPVSRINGPVTFNDRSNFQANQLYATFGRDVELGNCGWSFGGRADLLFGTDYIFTQAAGLELDDNGNRRWNRRGYQYGLAVPQIYGEVGLNDLSVKVGHFYTIIGNEVVTAPDNFFYSHAYTMQYGEPFTHTGALGTWQYNDRWTVYGGLVNGWDKFDAETDKISFLGGATYTPDHERYRITAALIHGDEDGINGNTNMTRTMYSLVFSYDVNDRWTYVAQHDNGWNNLDGSSVDQEWYGLNQYLFYTVNECWKLGIRGEWFRDDDGTRLVSAPLRSGIGGPSAPPGMAGNPDAFAGNYYNVSFGLNWTPTTNIVVRPELRLDWSDGTVVAPYDDFTKDSQLTAAFDAIWLY